MTTPEHEKSWQERFDEKFPYKHIYGGELRYKGVGVVIFLEKKEITDDLKSFITELIKEERKNAIEEYEKNTANTR